MADQDWKSRAGLNTNLSSSEDDEETNTSVGVPIIKARTHLDSVTDDFAAMSPTFATEFELDVLGYTLGSTPPRTRIARNMKDKRMRDSHDNVHSRNSSKNSRSRRRNSSVEVPRDDSLERTSYPEYGDNRHRRKRSLKLVRESERDFKLDLTRADGHASTIMASIVSLTAIDPAEDRAESMPTPAVKVETCKRFMSVASRPVDLSTRGDISAGEVPENDSTTTGDNECPKDRVGFYNTFSVLIRMGNPDRQQDNKNCRKQPSKEEALWQSELKDLVWLELQAWLADRTPTEQDTYLCESRKHVGALLAEIADYRFTYSPNAGAGDSVDSGVEATTSVNCNCLSMYCCTCVCRQNAALEQVEDLLSRLDAAVALYPSSRAMAEDHPLFESKSFNGRLRALCLWYNMTRLHRLKVSIIGKLLHQLRTQRGSTSNMNHWPRLYEIHTFSPVGSMATTNTQDASTPNTKPKSTQVQFRLVEPESPLDSTSPSESNSSTGSSIPNVAPLDSVFSLSSSRSSLGETGSSNNSAKNCMESFVPHLHDGSGKYGLSPYRAYIEEVLKSQGVKKAMQYLDRLHHHLLKKAHISLEKLEADSLIKENMPGEEWELRRFGHWSPEAQEMSLPSYRPAFLFLARIALDLIHEYLHLRLEQKPSEPSPLSIRQLMREMKEGLKEGVKQRQRYVHLMRSALWDSNQDVVDRLEQDVADFDRSMKAILEVYLEYLQQWVLMVQKESVLICPYQKTLLEEEWKFVKVTCPYIPNGEALAANSFCRMASGMLSAIEDNLNSGFDGLTSQLDDSSSADIEQKEGNPKQAMLTACRGVQSVFHEARERALRAVAFAKTLRKDLEIAASFEMKSSLKNFLLKLRQAGHVRVVAPHSCSHLMFVPACLKERPDLVCRLLNMNLTTSCLGTEHTDEQMGHYLVLARYDQDVDQLHWPGETIKIQPTAETTITLSHVEVQGVLLVVCDPSQLARNRRHLAQVLGCCVVLTQESLPSNYTIAESLSELKLDAVKLRDCITRSIVAVERRFDVREMTEVDEIDRASLASRCREILHQCYKVGFEYNKEVSRLITGRAEEQLARGMIEFAKQWMRFVGDRCERGRGLRPRWATQGLDFLMTACEPDRTKYLTDAEFEDLKSKIDTCVTHVIGSADKYPPRTTTIAEARSRGSSPVPAGRKPYRSSRSLPDAQSAQVAAQAVIFPSRSISSTPVVPSNPNLLCSPIPSRHLIELQQNEIDSSLIEPLKVPTTCGEAGWNDRVRDAVKRLEVQQDNKLRSLELIGTVTTVDNPDRVHIKARSVTFSWQRGIKIGQGRFGKVYTAVNNATGELMAMKEISFQPNDHRAIRSVAEELHIFEGIHHKHLIRYYGVEIHREEMLIFMEYCEEGTLESLIAAYQAGLPEHLVRSFARQLLSAVSTLHENGIVHRDIKSANIFLTHEGKCLKLGDFGSAVKIKAHTTMPGELNAYVGTQAYMAPEVFTKTNMDGHGRAADIWSVGCVVIEMASGKRPWHEFDSNFQIMFKVGMGEVPSCPPDSLSEEGHTFLDMCLKHDPRDRASADVLLENAFVKVEDDLDEEDDQYLIKNQKLVTKKPQ